MLKQSIGGGEQARGNNIDNEKDFKDWTKIVVGTDNSMQCMAGNIWHFDA